MVFACLDRNGRRSTSLRNIPGCAFSLLLGNLFYAWQAGRLGNQGGSNGCHRTTLRHRHHWHLHHFCSPSNYQRCWLVLRSTNLPTPMDAAEVQHAAYSAAEYAWEGLGGMQLPPWGFGEQLWLQCFFPHASFMSVLQPYCEILILPIFTLPYQ